MVVPERKLGRLNSISEKIWVDINGIEQGMFIESHNDANPVLLVVHGGPGMPDHFLTKRYPTGLEELFTVVWWEQRGTGLSYRADIPARDDDSGPIRRRHIGSDELPAIPFRKREDIPYGTFVG